MSRISCHKMQLGKMKDFGVSNQITNMHSYTSSSMKPHGLENWAGRNLIEVYSQVVEGNCYWHCISLVTGMRKQIYLGIHTIIPDFNCERLLRLHNSPVQIFKM
jgi:hypothetical protein